MDGRAPGTGTDNDRSGGLRESPKIPRESPQGLAQAEERVEVAVAAEGDEQDAHRR